MDRFVRVTHALHERVLIVTVELTELPYIASGERVEIRQIGAGLTRIILRFGFIEHPDIPASIRLAVEQGKIEADLDLAAITYVTGRDTVIPTGRYRRHGALARGSFLNRGQKFDARRGLFRDTGEPGDRDRYRDRDLSLWKRRSAGKGMRRRVCGSLSRAGGFAQPAKASWTMRQSTSPPATTR
jgi:hypothetical protein